MDTMSNKWLHSPVQFDLLQHRITTLPRDKYTWEDCLIRDTFTSVLGNLINTHLPDPYFEKCATHHAITSFISTRSDGYIRRLPGQQQIWFLPYVLLTMSDEDHQAFLSVVQRDYPQLDDEQIYEIHKQFKNKCQCNNCQAYSP